MAVEIPRRSAALSALLTGAEQSAAGATAAQALQAVAEAVRAGTAADLVLVRVVERGELVARAVAASASVAGELAGLRFADAVSHDEIDEVERLPAGARAVAKRVRASAVLSVPVRLDGSVVGSLDLLRGADEFGAEEREIARAGSAQAALVLRAFADAGGGVTTPTALQLLADALGAGSDPARTAERVARLVADVTGAEACLLWSSEGDDGLTLLGHAGVVEADTIRPLADAASATRGPARLEQLDGLLVASVPLGQQLGILQAVFTP
jgi:hypothetical protein